MAGSLKITPEGKVFLNDLEIEKCVSVSISNITAEREFKVEIHATVNALNIDYENSPLVELHKRD